MFCEALTQLVQRLTCAAPTALADALALAGLAAAVALVLLTLRRAAWRAAAGGVLFAVALILFAAAAGRPQLAAAPQPVEGGRIVAVIDGSDSVWRDGSAVSALEQLAATVAATAAALPPEARMAWQGHVLRFGRAAEPIAGPAPLDQLPAAILSAAPSAPTDASDAAAGFAAALELIRAGGGRGAILLLSDGLFSAPVPERLRAELTAAGVPVHVLAAGSARPAAGLVAADLGPEQRVGAPSPVRMTVAGGGRLSVTASGEMHTLELPDAPLRPARAAPVFVARGLQPAVIRFEADGAVQERVLYTLVRGPARVLAIGPAAFGAALDPARWAITRGNPLDPPAPEAFDLVLIDGLAPGDFRPGFPAELARAAAGGTGVLVINGSQRGAVSDPQRIADWEETPLGPLLPVSANPRFVIDAPPPRDVAILIDVSGSMSERGRMQTARAVAELILDSLGPQDSITIVRFGTRAYRFGPERATPEAIARARAYVRATQALNEGTDVNVALDEADRVRGAFCAYFLISDADFHLPWRSPECDAYAVGVAGVRYDPARVPLDRQRILRAGEIPGEMRFQFFEPEPRAEFWLAESFLPVAGAGGASALAPPLAVEGLALAYPRLGAKVLAFGPGRPAAPLAAVQSFPDRPEVATGVFLSALPSLWTDDPAGRAAIDALMSDLVGWRDDDRFGIRLDLAGEELVLTLTALADAGRPPPAALSARLIDGAGRAQPLALRPEGQTGRFRARAVLPRLADPGRGFLVVEPADGPTERIPMFIPADAAPRAPARGAEALDFGIDAVALQTLMQHTGGSPITDRVVAGIDAAATATTPTPRPLHPALVGLALCLLAASYWLGCPRGS